MSEALEQPDSTPPPPAETPATAPAESPAQPSSPLRRVALIVVLDTFY